MRRVWMAIVTAVLMLAALTACSGQTTPTEATVPETQAPTGAPFIDTQPDEPEWTLAEGDLQLEDQDNIYAESADILYFAIVTMDDGKQELRFRLNDETATMLTEQSPDNSYYMTLNGEKIGAAALSDDCTVVTVTAENAIGEITALASRIRGLAE